MQWITTQHIFLLFFFFGGVWKNNFNASIKWIYISYFSGSSGSRGLCVVLESYSKRPDFSRAESVIPSHADWLGYIWMTVLNLCALSSCLRTLPGGCATFKSRPDVSICISTRTQGNHILVIVMQSWLFFPLIFKVSMNVHKGTRLPVDPLKDDSKSHSLAHTYTVIIRAIRLHY